MKRADRLLHARLCCAHRVAVAHYTCPACPLCLYLCPRLRLQESFEHVREWLREVERYASPETCKLLIGNKSDRNDRLVSEAEGAALARELSMPFLETSARTAENVEQAFNRMAEDLIKIRADAEKEPRDKVSLEPAPAAKKGGCC